jgi:poly-beta-1,6 N-acetyl-D-glucosamine synthase
MSIVVILFLSLLVVTLVRIFSLWTLSIAYAFQRYKPKTPTEKISIIVPAFNEEQSIAQCVESLLGQSYEDFEIIVVDDGSSDRTFEIARSYEGPKVKVIHQENKGKSGALNTGIAAATGGIVLTVDADTRLNQSALRNLAERFSERPRLGAVAGNVKVYKANGLLQKLQEAEYTTSVGLTRKGQSMLASVMIVPGPIAAFRKETVELVHGFSSDTFAEDFDITLDVLKAHYAVEYEDRAIAYTIAPKSTEDLLKQRRRWYRGMIQVLAKHEGMFFRKKYGVAGVYGIPFMFFDTVSPIINLFLVIFAVLTGLVTGQWTTILFGLSAYWILQISMVILSVGLDRERRWSEIAISPLMIFYNTFLDGVRIAAFVEELLSLRMKWETPRR